MEEPNEEWGTQEYASEECNEGKVSWILNKGLELGRKMLITGFVISSAPLVLPPLVVISAIGFAVSVPSGIVLASYACTEKLMNKFLPMPHHLEKGEVVEGQEAWLGGDYYFDMGKEDEEERKDIQRGVEERIELKDEKVTNDEIEEGKVVEEGDYGKEAVKGDVDVPIEENGYEEDVGEDSDLGKESPEEKPKEKPEENIGVKSTNDKEDQALVDESQSKEEEPVKVEGVILNLTAVEEESGESTVEVTAVVIEGKGGEEGSKEEEMEIRDEGKAENQETPQESSASKGDQSGVSTAELPTSQGAEEPKDAGSSSEKGAKSTPSNEAKKKKNVEKKQQQVEKVPPRRT